MGERLAQEIDEVFQSKIEESPIWRKAQGAGEIGITDREMTELIVHMVGATREAVRHLAREVDDPATHT
ncbi:MAG: hypothetical protein ACYCU0_10635 [Solirubrobacteraceae bacterium]